jgi:hypothetical protein
MFDERAGDNAAPKLSGGLSLGPLSSRRIQVSVCGRARKTHLRFTYKRDALFCKLLLAWSAESGSACRLPAVWRSNAELDADAVCELLEREHTDVSY